MGLDAIDPRIELLDGHLSFGDVASATTGSRVLLSIAKRRIDAIDSESGDETTVSAGLRDEDFMGLTSESC